MNDYITSQNNPSQENEFELSHIIGLNSNLINCLQAHPSMVETIIYCVGGIIITEDLTEKNNQVFFRHGINQISCFEVSNSGRLLAVGFVTEILEKKLPASIIIWDFEKKKVLYELTGIFKGIKQITFSPDDKFISAIGLDNTLFIWDTSTGYKCYNRVFEYRTNTVYWARITQDINNKHKNYSIIISNVNNIFHYFFYYELKSMQYAMQVSTFSLPSTGFVRTFTCSGYDYNQNLLYCGTTGGELCIFDIDKNLYKTSYNVINNGLNNLIILEDSSIIISGGDGKIKKLIYENKKHVLAFEIQLEGSINSLSLTADKKEAVCSTNTGLIYRILVTDLTFASYSTNHYTAVNDCDYANSLENDKFYAVDDTGALLLWDLNDFSIVSSYKTNSNCINKTTEKATSVYVGEDNTIFVGYNNGFLRNLLLEKEDKTALNTYKLLWEIPAHRGSINTIYVDGNYIITGGEDGIVRIWTRQTHELIIDFSAHHKNVFSVIPDRRYPNIIYTGGEDKNMNCFDIKLQKRVNVHHLKNGLIKAMDQKIDDEKEIVSIGYNCGLAIWDFYKNEPIGEINLSKNFHCLKISHGQHLVAVGSEDGEIWLFKMPDLKFIGKSSGHSGVVKSLKWSPDDKQIITTSVDASICIWNVYIEKDNINNINNINSGGNNIA